MQKFSSAALACGLIFRSVNRQCGRGRGARCAVAFPRLGITVEFRHDFHRTTDLFSSSLVRSSQLEAVEQRGKCGESPESDAASCTIIGHCLVDDVQQTDSKGDKSSCF